MKVLGVKMRGGHAYQVLAGEIVHHLATPDSHHRGRKTLNVLEN